MKKVNASLTAASVALFVGMNISSAALAEIAIIAHPKPGADALTAKAAKKLFLGKTKSVPSMDSITLVATGIMRSIKAVSSNLREIASGEGDLTRMALS